MDFDKMMIAMEADDISVEVREEKKEVLGTSDDDDRDISQTEDIFGLDKDNEPSGEDDDANPEEETDEDASLDDVGDDEDTGDDSDMGEEESPEAEEVSPEEKRDLESKRKLRSNMILFYNIIDTNLESLGELRSANTDPEVRTVLNSVVSNLNEVQQRLHDLIITNFKTVAYPDLLKKYVALNQVYDICVHELEKTGKKIELLQKTNTKKKK